MKNNKRIKQLTFMMNAITEIGLEDAEKIVLSTEIGKAILENNTAALYEQQTENLAEIADELQENARYQNVAKQLTVENIVRAGKLLRKYEIENRKKVPVIYEAVKQDDVDKAVIKQGWQEKQKALLKAKRQNKINAGRIKNAY